ncbi:O-acetyl-ADP-ribose deacetylase [Lactobacillus sp. ESL0791]|uniref:O-acetyl-ADP-ribose deacetylase n=1 Tax=Lactobacillus sp. ESL0791 TaxID=2983234 RepID=UPI0023F97835|nr:O-acetyl-ADP-ribose deacetylase [Lactobacillus sp. ESL0791]MDF7638026.1 O-acetyl-ADP-ribose deacetylase [Lactobacillus sp. ESL0791]
MTKITIIQADITKIKADAIVNAANKSLLGGLGVDGAIHQAAGPKLLEECRTLHGCATGQAKITKGYNLPAKYVIHTVGPVYSGIKQDNELLAACYHNCLELAKQRNLHSIVFPAISTGAYGFPAKAASRIAFETIKQWLTDNADYEMQVTMCAYDHQTARLFKDTLAAQNK